MIQTFPFNDLDKIPFYATFLYLNCILYILKVLNVFNWSNSMVEDDVQLIHKVLSGEDAAFSTLVQKYQKSVHAFAWRKIGDFHFAEEITQDTFVQVYQNLSTLRNPNLFAGWLYVIANRLCIRWKQKRKSMFQSLESTSMSDIDATSYSKYTSEQRDLVSTERRLEIVDKLLKKLPESERTVITLFYLGEMTAKEIGMFLGVSINTIKSRLSRARERLKSEEAILQENLGCIQFPTQTTENVMRRISQLNPTGSSGSKPLVPIGLSAVSAIVVLLLMGVGGIHLHRFQKPFSLESTSESTIEIVDSQIVLESPVEIAARIQVGRSDVIGRDDGAEQQLDTSLVAAADIDETVNSDFDSELVQSKGPEGGTISTLFTTTNGDVFAGTINGLYRLTDDHTTWKFINPIKGPSPPLHDNQTWWSVAERDATLYLATNTAILKSADRGETWETLCEVVQGDSENLEGMVLTDGEQDAEMTIYLAYKKGVFRSNNLGESWIQLLDGLEDTNIRSIAVFQDTIFAGTNNGLYLLKNNQWEQVLIDQENLRGITLNVSSLVVAANNLYVAALKVEDDPSNGIDVAMELLNMGIELPPFTFYLSLWSLYRLNDRGDSWTNITPKLDVKNKKGYFIRDYSTSLYRTFIVENPSIQLTASEDKVFMVAGNYHFYSTDLGQNWTYFDSLSDTNNVSGAVLLNDDTFYRSGLSGIHRTTDGGTSWEKFNTGLINTFVHRLTNINDTLYANMMDLRVMRSTDKGESWTHIDGDSQKYSRILEFEDTLYAMNSTESPPKLFRFSNAKNRFIEISDQPDIEEAETLKHNKVVEEVLLDLESSDEIETPYKTMVKKVYTVDSLLYMLAPIGNFAVSRTAYYVEYKQRLYRWKPGTKQWYDTGLKDTGKFADEEVGPQEIFNAYDLGFKLAVLKDTVYVGTRDKQLMQSFDEGDTWNDVTAVLPYGVESFKDIVFVGETVYVATDICIASSANGVDWETITDPQGNLLVVDRFAVDESSLYGLSKNIVYQLSEKSGTWRQVTPEITQSVSTFDVDGDTVYVGTQGQGVFRYSLDELE